MPKPLALVIIASATLLAATALRAGQFEPPVQGPLDPTESCPLTVPPFDDANPEILTHEGALDVRIIDLDGDGDRDLVTFNQPQGLAQNIVFYENGLSGGAQPPSLFSVMPPSQILHSSLLVGGNPDPDVFRSIYEVQFVDVDGDGAKDMIAGRLRFTDFVFLRKSGVFQPPTPIFANQQSDYCTCVPGSPQVDCGSTTICSSRYTTGLAVGDVNRDGAVDVVACYRDSRPRLYVNDGTGTFCEDQVFPIPPGETSGAGWNNPGAGFRDVQLADLDHDGDYECILARMQGTPDCCNDPLVRQVVVYENVGYDPDCDGTLDPQTPFRFWYELQPSRLDPDGTDTPGAEGSPSLTINTMDVDGDGDYDLLQPMLNAEFGTGPCSPPRDYRTRIYLNDGQGFLGGKDPNGNPNFRPSLFVGDVCDDNLRASWAYPVDVDRDGDYDLAVGHHQGDAPGDRKDRIWRNDGPDANGLPTYSLYQEFESSLAGQGSNDNTRYMRFADLDQDGDQDLVETNFAAGAFPRIFYGQWSDQQVRRGCP